MLLFVPSILFAIAVQSAPLDTNASPVVDLGYATYQGVLDPSTNVTNFTGIRYAAPPTGKNRFQAPKSPANVSGVQVANLQPPQCMQDSVVASSDEDCLFLNVFLPGSLEANAKLPVVVWIHGGGYVLGSMNVYDGADLITETGGGLIVVTIQYRLGIFGFLAGNETKNLGSLNAGLLDQNFALQWVQKHIASFGGDPKKVTVWGQSAGAGSVLQHIVAHGGNTNPPLFNTAMTSSTFLPSQYNFADAVPETIYSDAIKLTNCSSSANTFDCLQSVDVDVLNAANINIALNTFSTEFVFAPVVDGSFILERPLETLRKGKVNGDVLFSNTNSFEGGLFVNPNITGPLSNFVTQLFPNLTEAQVNAIVQAYSDIGLESTLEQAVGVIGESVVICPTYFLLEAFPGSHKSEFAIPPAIHADDVPYYFPSAPGVGDAFYNNSVFITSFSQSFLAVVKSQDPNITPDPINITPQWNPWQDRNAEVLFNKTAAGLPDIRTISTNAGLLQRCSLWRSLSASTPQ